MIESTHEHAGETGSGPAYDYKLQPAAPTMGAIFDCETTGVKEPDVIELCFTDPMEFPLTYPVTLTTTRYLPRKAIEFGAMATHHILPGALLGHDDWTGQYQFAPEIGYVVGHNVDFDWKAIGSPSVKRICTLALSRKLWPEADSHALVAMLYFLAYQKGADLRLVRDRVKDAHSANIDVSLTYELLGEIVEKLGIEAETWEGLWQASEKARVPERMDFGRYGPDSDWGKANGGKGMQCAAVKHRDPGYYRWLLNQCDRVTDDPYLRKALVGS